ncbi:uncharacterized protein olf186-M isoform X2 [Venturia canescens]|nr:uncharacterized protein LOC122416461 isoform X2 [Venturia canescens]
MRRKTGPVQQWVDSIPSPTKSAPESQSMLEDHPTPPLTPVSLGENIFIKPTMTVSTPIAVPNSPLVTRTGVSSPVAHSRLARDPSFQSDSSHCSSVESLLELRRADPEAILLGLGFGGCPNHSQENGPLSRIPKRFLQPSKLQGITINDFVKHEQETSESLDSASLGYRGLTGSPYVAPSEIVQKIMERLREHESHEQDPYTMHNTNTEPYSPIFQDISRLSVLSPDNRQFLERPRSKSPDMRNKRMIIGQKSFAFGCDGDLIEIDSLDHQDSGNSSTNGNADNHEIELEDNFVLDGSTLSNNFKTSQTHPVDGRSKSTMSKLKMEKRLSKQSSIDDTAQDLSFPNNISPPVKSPSHFCDNTSHHQFEGSNLDAWNNNEHMSNNRRSSSDSGDVKKLPWARLSRDTGRRYSDSSLRQGSDLFNRRKSLRRQSRISDNEAVKFGGTDSLSELVLPERPETAESDKKLEENAEISENSSFEENELEGRIERSDRLSQTDGEEDSNISNGQPVTNEEKVEITSSKKPGKKRHGLSSLRGIYNSVVSVKMEPGF